MPHVGVMKEEISSLLKDVPEGYFIDATYGDGSHFDFIDSEKKFTAIGFDRDYDSIANKKNNHNVVQLNFSEIKDYLEKRDVKYKMIKKYMFVVVLQSQIALLPKLLHPQKKQKIGMQ